MLKSHSRPSISSILNAQIQPVEDGNFCPCLAESADAKPWNVKGHSIY